MTARANIFMVNRAAKIDTQRHRNTTRAAMASGYGGAYGAESSRNRNSRGPTTPVYQIDFSAVAAGKRVASTKRRVRW